MGATARYKSQYHPEFTQESKRQNRPASALAGMTSWQKIQSQWNAKTHRERCEEVTMFCSGGFSREK